jgi:hypothetical protein
MADFVQKWQKRDRKISHRILYGEFPLICSLLSTVPVFLNNKARMYVNKEQFFPNIFDASIQR